MSVRVEFLDDAAFDSLAALPQPHLDVAWGLLEHLATHPSCGKPLGDDPLTGRLAGTRSVYVIDFDERIVNWPPPYRIVYRLLPSESKPEVAQVIHVSARNDLAVYRVAARRLGR